MTDIEKLQRRIIRDCSRSDGGRYLLSHETRWATASGNYAVDRDGNLWRWEDGSWWVLDPAKQEDGK